METKTRDNPTEDAALRAAMEAKLNANEAELAAHRANLDALQAALDRVKELAENLDENVPQWKRVSLLDFVADGLENLRGCLLYTSPSPRDRTRSRMPSSA